MERLQYCKSLLIVAVLACSGCKTGDPELEFAIPSSAVRVEDPAAAIADRTTDSNWVVLRSHGGIWVGADDDCDIEIHADGFAKTTFYGHGGVNEYLGQYACYNSLVRVHFQDFELPLFHLYLDGESLMLVPYIMPDNTKCRVIRRDLKKGGRRPAGNRRLFQEIGQERDAG